MEETNVYTAFAGGKRVAAGPLETFLPKLKSWADRHPGVPPLVFEDQTGRPVDFDLRGAVADVLARATGARTGPGRPKLGVVPREVSLLPRHWDWLEHQPNGASAALRRLIDEARRNEPERQQARRARDAAYRCMSVLAGNRPGFEEASRALFAADRARFEELTRKWPKDVRTYLETRTIQAWAL
jgi:hypothetical protein